MIEVERNRNCVTCGLVMDPVCMLDNEGLKVFNEDRYEVTYKAGEIIFKRGGPLTHIACLTSGMLKTYMEGSLGKNIILSLITPGEIVGGPGFEVDYKHHFSVAAVENSQACLVSIEKFRALLEADSKFALEVIRYINTKNIKGYEKLVNLTQKQMNGRVADTLLYLSEKIYKNNRFKTQLSRQELADFSALTKESTIRILKGFNVEGIISHSGSDFHILNKKALRKISQTG